jgi:peptidoglycan L-alanyl-D-glutamate endopeptidase CwlK
MDKRGIEYLTPELRPLCDEFIQRCKCAGVDVMITCTLRSRATQAAYWARGRAPLSEVNRLYALAGLAPITAEQNRKKVTWTKNSRHFPGPDGLSRAFDFAVLKDGQPVWDLKADIDADQIPDYLECARIARDLELESGAFWDNPDYPHVQLKGV